MEPIMYEGEPLSERDMKYIDTEVRKAYEDMEVHLEIFTLPSGLQLKLWCDGTWDISGSASLEEKEKEE